MTLAFIPSPFRFPLNIPRYPNMVSIRPGSFWKNANPTGAIADFVLVFRNAGRGRWWVMGAAALTTLTVFWPIMHEEARVLPKPPTITYITTYRPGRTDAEIMASNRANQRIQDRLNVEQAERDAEVKRMYKVIGKASGLDVEKMDREGRADAAADARKEAARQAALYGAGHVTPHP